MYLFHFFIQALRQFNGRKSRVAQKAFGLYPTDPRKYKHILQVCEYTLGRRGCGLISFSHKANWDRQTGGWADAMLGERKYRDACASKNQMKHKYFLYL